MELFLSYRRDDTGGRAGRLFDALVTRYGRNHVFHDVNTVEPGLNFVRQVEAAIKRSDAVLVVIGPHWLSSPAPDGSRRIDSSDDFVRREVGMALEADARVVPVLVDGASLPPASEMPDHLLPLLERHAVSIRDVSWQRDVDDLIRRLEGEAAQPSEPGKSRRRLVVGGLVGAAAIAAGAVALATQGGDDGDKSEYFEPPPCETPQASWDTVPLIDDPTSEITIGEHTVLLGVQRLALEPTSDGATLAVVDVEVRNVTDASVPTAEDVYYYTWAEFDGLFIDGVGHLDVACQDILGGDPNLTPGDAIRGRVGYTTSFETTGALYQLRMNQGSVTINER